ncbi:hypothetical protein ETB97_003325 [Aspergillus alliaceus]|uniref:DJ-1/PfpI domain-containing protein n=1 Tax=Petromyces alliaceus TaxID=209559 RepID=A0A8H6E5E1_PETAA|nr:hypothetical protein ETB97_003325 [Aspergillus burnettii]
MAPLQFGIVLYDFQLLDVAAPIDLLSSVSKKMLTTLERTGHLPKGTSNEGLDIEFHYLAPTLDSVTLMTGFRLQPTTTFEDCPKLDAILLGGPGPDFWDNIPESYVKFFHQKAEEVEYFFTTCTGGIVAGKAGLLRGKRATTNHEFMDFLPAQLPETKWEKTQWVIDGKFWTAAGALAGLDMFDHWLRGKTTDTVLTMAHRGLDYQPRNVNGNLIG